MTSSVVVESGVYVDEPENRQRGAFPFVPGVDLPE
jgi:hypothetical protein